MELGAVIKLLYTSDYEGANAGIQETLEDLDTISDVAISASILHNDTDAPYPSVRVSIMVGFHAKGKETPAPQNLGPLPLMQVRATGLVGVTEAYVEVVQKGQPPVNVTFAEQTLTLNASAATFDQLTGNMTLMFENATTAGVPPNASATEMREALMELETIGEVEVFRRELMEGPAGALSGIAWDVRFYDNGLPQHKGPQPDIIIDPTNLELSSSSSSAAASRRQLSALGISLGVATTVAGESVALLEAAELEDAGPEPTIEYNPTNESDGSGEIESVSYLPPVHICGNGVRSTAEQCDDNNTVGGDGCNALCQVELGYECTSTNHEGSGVGGMDECAPKCGDGRRIVWDDTEDCDDNNTKAGDGCGPYCKREPGWQCSGGSLASKDTCVALCADGLRVGPEVCDDGNTIDGDGCQADCSRTEDGWACAGGSSKAVDVCVQCDASCATCFGPLAWECATCAPAHPLLDTPSTCVASCTPLRKYANSSAVCVDCDPACATCSGPSSTDCLSCAGQSAAFLHGGTCVESCPIDTFAEVIDTDRTICSPCACGWASAATSRPVPPPPPYYHALAR